jgi:hypothetical protein
MQIGARIKRKETGKHGIAPENNLCSVGILSFFGKLDVLFGGFRVPHPSIGDHPAEASGM